MKLKISLIVSIILFVSSGQLFSQKTIRIQKTDNPPVADGLVNDKCWETAASFGDFLQREPREGEPMTEETKVYICYDANNIYFGIRCFEDARYISAKEMARDAKLGTDDRIAVILDTYNDHRTAYFFGLNALGSKEDAIVNPNGFNRSWDGLWIGKAKITDIGWEAEMIIPFKSIGFDKKSTHWGLFMNRFITKKNEWGSWPVAKLNSSEFQVSDAGIIEGLEGITQGVGLDIAPYLISGFDTKREDKTKYKINAGSDIFYQITPSMKASLSLNTDFAETEADARQINLTRFSIRLDEKRKFFLDGSNYFNFGIEGRETEAPSGKVSPFFSRRMGLDAEGTPIPVNYGAKLTGQIKRWNIGLMHVNDDRSYGNSNFSVGRVSYNIGEQSSVGMITTMGNSHDSLRNILGGLDLKLVSSKFRGDRNLALNLFGIKSSTESVHGKDVSWGATFIYPNDFLNLRIGHIEIGENFVAGMGYIPRKDIRETFVEVTLGPRLNRWGIRQLLFGGEFDYVVNFDNKLQTKKLSINPVGIRFESGEIFSYDLIHKYDFLKNDFNIYDDYVIPLGEYQWWEHQLSLRTLGSRSVYGRLTYEFGDFYNGRQQALALTANWKIAVPVFVGGALTTNVVKLPDGEFTANIIEVNANYLFSPDMTLYNYLQYDSKSEIFGWQSRFQWILKPGNEIILVWNSGFTKPVDHFVLNESALRFKLKFNIRF